MMKASPEQLILFPNELEIHMQQPFDPEEKSNEISIINKNIYFQCEYLIFQKLFFKKVTLSIFKGLLSNSEYVQLKQV